MRAIQTLEKFGPQAAEAVPALIDELTEEKFRRATMATLGKIGPAAVAAVPALEAIDDIFANAALEKITDEL